MTKEQYIVTARKWRPLKFSEIAGQEHITTTLKNAIKSNRMHHAYLFSGPRGVGKTTTARIYARALNCLNPNDFEPCNECINCKAVLESKSLDIMEIDGASNNSVDDVRKLRDNAKYPPSNGEYKMYIIDEVHMLSTAAFNALLKTLEEPPPHLMFVFATTEAHKVPATILSRCQRFDFRRMESPVITDRLQMIAGKEGISIDEQSLLTIAKKADGSMRDAQSIFDQAVAFCGKDISYENLGEALHLIDLDYFFRISDAVSNSNLKEIFHISKDTLERGYDLRECLFGLIEHYRNVLTVKVTGNSDLIEAPDSFLRKYEEVSTSIDKSDVLRILSMLKNSEASLRFSPQPRITFELILVNIASMDKSVEIDEILNALGNNTALPEKKTPEVKFAPKPQPKKRKIADLKPKVEVNPPDIKPIDDIPKVSETIASNIRKTPRAEIETRWTSFLEQFGNGEYGLKNLKTCHFKFEDGMVHISTEDKFIFDNLELKRVKINDALDNFFSGQVGFNLSMNEYSGSPPETKSENLPEQDSSNSHDADDPNLHPIEKELIKLFDAVKVSRNDN